LSSPAAFHIERPIKASPRSRCASSQARRPFGKEKDIGIVRVPGRHGAMHAAVLTLLLVTALPSRAETLTSAAAPGHAAAPSSAAPPGHAAAPVSAPAHGSPARSQTAGPPGASATPPAAAPPGRAETPSATPFSEVFAGLASRLVGVVVNISTTQATAAAPGKAQGEGQPPAPGTSLDELFRDFFGERGAPGGLDGLAPPAASLGSGFVIDASGLIVTNNHVIANADKITVTLSDNTMLEAHVVGRDPVSDLALLKIDPKAPLPAATWGDSGKTRVGDWVLAIGNPFGLGGTVTSGIISATARDIHTGPYDDFLQTDASINRGNSGGPMFNLKGEVIGINTAIYSPSGGSIGIGFAIPSDAARPIIDQLKTTGKVERGWIGAQIQPVSDDIAEAIGLDKGRGAMIASIDSASPAATAKLQPGDVILAYDGKPIDRSRQLPRLVADTPPGKTVKLSVWRDGKAHPVDVRVSAFDANRPVPPAPEPEKPKPSPAIDAFGIKLSPLTSDLRKQFALADAAKGVVITDVPPTSAAAAQGLRAGDLIIAVGDNAVTTPGELEQKTAAAKKTARKNLLVRVERDGITRFVALPVGG
jgi:serine protease Do